MDSTAEQIKKAEKEVVRFTNFSKSCDPDTVTNAKHKLAYWNARIDKLVKLSKL